jgi:hypothetical protein
MLSRPKDPPSSSEVSLIYAEKRVTDHWLHRVQQVVSWKSFSRELEKPCSANG